MPDAVQTAVTKQEPTIPTVLLIGDTVNDTVFVHKTLAEVRGEGFELECVERLSAAVERLSRGGIDVVLLDLALRDVKELDGFRRVHAQAPEVPVVVVTVSEDENLAIRAVQEGAQDYLIKGEMESNVLARSLRYAIQRNTYRQKLSSEIIQREQAEGRLRKESGAVAAVLSNMLRGEVDDAETESRVLDACLAATDSVYGMVGVINEHGQFDTTTYASQVTQDCPFPEALTWELTTGMPIRGIWGWPMLRGEALACNDLAAHPDRVGQPEGHIAIHCYLGAPLKRDSEVVGMIAVANKPGGYTEEDKETLVRLAAVISVSRQHREALKNAKRTSAELARSNQELEQFAYIVSHDLQSPLRTMSGFAQLLNKSYRDTLDERADGFIQEIVDGAGEMKRLIDDLLQLSRVQRHQRVPEPTHCSEMLDEALGNLRAAIEESGAVVKRGDLPKIPVNRSQFVQLFQNLISNAIKYRGEEAPRIDVAAERRGDDWRFSFRDNGIGIDSEHLDRVFVIFQRLHAREEYSGTGIGLAICKKIVEIHGGRIWAESEPGKGSTFYFTIPASD